jgi:two-component system CheB/CheR fusion protein
MHGGTVRAYSAGPGQGTRVRLTLPLAEPGPVALPAADTPAVHADGAPGLAVLLADDNIDAAELLATILRAEGHTVDVTYDGLAAIERAGAAPPQAMVLDIGMPGANGYEVARWVRAQPWGADVLLVAVTGWGHVHDGDRPQRAGFDVRLVKPIVIEQLLAALRERRGRQE